MPKRPAPNFERLRKSPAKNIERIKEQVREDRNAMVRREVANPSLRAARLDPGANRKERDKQIKETMQGINAIGTALVGRKFRERSMKGCKSNNVVRAPRFKG